MSETIKATVAAVTLALTLTACTAMVRTHGYVPAEEDLQQIVPGIDTRASVEELVGVPSTAGVLRDSGFYYIESQIRTFAWQAPEVIDRTVVEIAFDPAGVVTGITTYGLEDGQVVPLTRRVTKSGDGDISFIRKLFGNIGGFTAEQLLGGGN